MNLYTYFQHLFSDLGRNRYILHNAVEHL